MLTRVVRLGYAELVAKRVGSWVLLLSAIALGAGGCGEDESEPPRGALGESCTARRDCAGGLACIGNVCVDPANPGSPAQGGLGESCLARNDCAAGLACIANVCVPEKTGPAPTAKSCYEVECASKDDCCQDFVPSPGCDKYKADCDADPAYCLTYRLFCECNRDCESELCVDTPPGCAAHAECVSLLTPLCVNGRCAECAQHGDCPGEQDRCVDGECQPPCALNEHCPILHACQDGECVEVGCATDRECFFLTKDSRSICASGECLVPCTHHAECADFQVCHEGTCVFVGCENDAECRAYLGLSEQQGDVKAVCK